MGFDWEDDATAESYLKSDVHRTGDDLSRLSRWAGDPTSVLDIGSGPGHTGIAVRCPSTERTVLLDTSHTMVKLGSETFSDVITVVGESHRLPFVSSSFEIVTCRVAAHHFHHPEQFLRDVYSILEPGGKLLFEDNVAPNDAETDRLYNKMETLRDPSHVRCHTVDEWKRFMKSAGFTPTEQTLHDKTLDFVSWLERTETSMSKRRELEELILSFPTKVRDQLDVRIENEAIKSFSPLTVLICATKKE